MIDHIKTNGIEKFLLKTFKEGGYGDILVGDEMMKHI